ncbi:MAG TPA: hypothetical protein VFE13_15830 [Caulobacteraceae bacterium]|jgi:hypothetical protein|nr:hypothetical protein [Caulobacteraceae bacterium]
MSEHAVGRGQRVSDEVEIAGAHDGKEKAKSAKPRTAPLPQDLNTSPPAQPVTTEDVVDVADTPSSWEAVESDDRKAGRGTSGHH